MQNSMIRLSKILITLTTSALSVISSDYYFNPCILLNLSLFVTALLSKPLLYYYFLTQLLLKFCSDCFRCLAMSSVSESKTEKYFRVKQKHRMLNYGYDWVYPHISALDQHQKSLSEARNWSVTSRGNCTICRTHSNTQERAAAYTIYLRQIVRKLTK